MGRRRQGRNPSLFDLMALIASVGITIAIYGACYPPPATWPIWGMRTFTVADWATYITALAFLSWPILTGLTIPLAAATFQAPRASRRRDWRRPGAQALFAFLTVFAIAVVMGWVLSPTLYGTPVRFPWSITPRTQRTELSAFLRTLHAAGPAILATWLAALLSGRWRPAPHWLDRLGRLVGSLWIVWGLSQLAITHF